MQLETCPLIFYRELCFNLISELPENYSFKPIQLFEIFHKKSPELPFRASLGRGGSPEASGEPAPYPYSIMDFNSI
jgi:hypothetical protein